MNRTEVIKKYPETDLKKLAFAAAFITRALPFIYVSILAYADHEDENTRTLSDLYKTTIFEVRDLLLNILNSEK